MPNRSRKRSRPRPEIEPIHLGELLGGAGMRGFLSILEAPFPGSPAKQSAGPLLDGGLSRRFSARAEKTVVRFKQQEEALRAVTEIVRRIKRGVITLQAQSEAIWRRRSRRPTLEQRGAS